VRLALGARPIEVLWMALRENLRLAAIGSAAGIALALVGLRALDGLLFGLSPTDTMNLVAAAGVLVLVALAAGIVPARRAASVDPLVALRAE
jgi:putative ABC transport system permease protein